MKTLGARRLEERYDERTITVRKIDAAVKRAAELNMSAPPLMVCDPQGARERRFHNYIGNVEPGFRAIAATEPGHELIVGESDKARQNPLNKLGTNVLGDQFMKCHWKVAGRAIAITGAIVGPRAVRAEFARVAPSSDESRFAITAEAMAERIRREFGGEASADLIYKRAYLHARREENLHEYGGEVGGMWVTASAFSRILMHPPMVVASVSSVSNPIRIDPKERGFIMREIAKLESAEIRFFEMLPESLRGITRELPEVVSPFETSLQKMEEAEPGSAKRDRGTFIEIKFAAEERDARALLRFTPETRKGYAEIYSEHFGMRLFNTYIGKPRTNGVLTCVAQAMGDLAGLGVSVLPVNGGYLQYWVDMAPGDRTRRTIMAALGTRVRSSRDETGHMDIGLSPSVRMLDAAATEFADVRQRFIMDSLGYEFYPPQTLDMTDFMLNFIENVHPTVQEHIFENLSWSGRNPLSVRDLKNIQRVQWICSNRRTIRDTEDLVWTLRMDEQLPEEIKNERGRLESWLFEFSFERFGQVFDALIRRISSEVGRGAINPWG